MTRTARHRISALLTSAALLASLTLVTVAATTSAARPTCLGEVATIVGTNRGETIVGTAKADVIVALGGNDIIRGLGGADRICGGGGKDKLVGGAGNDRLDGGSGLDTCPQGGGRGALRNCELPSAALAPAPAPAPAPPPTQAPTPAPTPPPTPEPTSAPRVFAIAFTDLDGDHAFGSGDVLIAKLVDTDGDKIPSVGDTIKMGRYPTSLTPGPDDFADWGVQSHAVTGFDAAVGGNVWVRSAAGSHRWVGVESGSLQGELYDEFSAVPRSFIQDGFVGTDAIYVVSGSPSDPATPIGSTSLDRPGDDGLIDVVIDVVIYP